MPCARPALLGLVISISTRPALAFSVFVLNFSWPGTALSLTIWGLGLAAALELPTGRASVPPRAASAIADAVAPRTRVERVIRPPPSLRDISSGKRHPAGGEPSRRAAR